MYGSCSVRKFPCLIKIKLSFYNVKYGYFLLKYYSFTIISEKTCNCFSKEFKNSDVVETRFSHSRPFINSQVCFLITMQFTTIHKQRCLFPHYCTIATSLAVTDYTTKRKWKCLFVNRHVRTSLVFTATVCFNLCQQDRQCAYTYC
jgi:hypothetical protein